MPSDPNTYPKRILIVVPSLMAMEIVRATIQSDPGMEVAGWSRTVAEALVAARDIKPDGLIAEERLPDGSGVELLAKLVISQRTCRFVLLLDRNGEFALQEAEKARVHGILDRAECGGAELIRCFKAVLGGRSYWSPAILEAKKIRIGRPDAAAKVISDAERRVLRLIALGLNNAEIARTLRVSPATIRTHRGRIMKKLSIPSTPRLIRAAFLQGLVLGLDSALIRP